jgi:sulfur carrier protein
VPAGGAVGYNARMQIMLNGSPRECTAGTTLALLLDEAGYAERRVAVEVNREIVPKSLHVKYMLGEGDRVEIVHAIGGG